MGSSAAVWLVLVVAILAANLPFANERLFAVGPRRQPKGLGWRVLELAVLPDGSYGFIGEWAVAHAPEIAAPRPSVHR